MGFWTAPVVQQGSQQESRWGLGAFVSGVSMFSHASMWVLSSHGPKTCIRVIGELAGVNVSWS